MMPKRGCDYVTVSPPTFDRTEFPKADRLLSPAHGPYSRSWLMARFDEGLHIRLLRPPYEGFVVFQPGKLAWRPVENLDSAVMVHDLRVAAGPGAAEAKARLWRAVEEFASFYGYALAVALIGDGDGAVAPDTAPGRGWVTADRGPDGTRLVARVLAGPALLPAFPRDWQRRANALGPGVTIQTTGESAALEARAAALVADLRGMRPDLAVRHRRLSTPEQAQRQAVCPRALYSVVRDGVRLGGPAVSAEDILAAGARS
jgi:hypothetical protein